MPIHNKLVRDGIPGIIESTSKRKMAKALLMKLNRKAEMLSS
ncbi:hypothetical protein ABE288_09610 [Bacillus salipaludis]